MTAMTISCHDVNEVLDAALRQPVRHQSSFDRLTVEALASHDDTLPAAHDDALDALTGAYHHPRYRHPWQVRYRAPRR